MDIKEYIASGILELYVAGQLSEEENLKVAEYAKTYPEIQTEIEEIEASILALSKAVSPKVPLSFDVFKQKIEIDESSEVVPLKKKRVNAFWYVGWAASLLLTVGLAYLYMQNEALTSEIKLFKEQSLYLEKQIEEARNSLARSKALLENLRDRNVEVVPLGGQEVAPSSYAKIYWNKEQQKLLVDAQGLPDPPEGMVYQVWSLTLNPLTPTSVGLLEDFTADENRIFELANNNSSEAFGITLEPAGGSASPNLEQLYTLGTVSG
ncbi:anti-sigma factor [Flavobacteriaceae bacterium TP-CH-4]|uniref:Anti-sigma factor n=1 Tax=Pelagihabitans pacificus TaxID=2696054 RepID=A0A967B0V4_9FLAO|nr:anti-sigma factor [Pelagihabitans pacificus]NHF61047.1 anti-sigma factor [Pelagihabitans pacificus]